MKTGTIFLQKLNNQPMAGNLFSKFVCSTKFIVEKKHFTEITIILEADPKKSLKLQEKFCKPIEFSMEENGAI